MSKGPGWILPGPFWSRRPHPPKGQTQPGVTPPETHTLPSVRRGTMCSWEPQATRKSPQLTERAGPVTLYPPLLGAVGGGRLLQGLVELAVRRQQDWDPLDLHRRDTWGPGRGLGVTAGMLPGRGQCPHRGSLQHSPPEPQRVGQGAGHRLCYLSCTSWSSPQFPGRPQSRGAL